MFEQQCYRILLKFLFINLCNNKKEKRKLKYFVFKPRQVFMKYLKCCGYFLVSCIINVK